MFKSKRHMILSLKKKSGVQLSDSEIKELLGIENQEVKEPEKKPEEKPAAPAATEEKPEEKPEDKTKEVDPSAAPSLSLEDLGAAVATLTENVNMIMEAIATMMDGQSTEVPAAAPAEEAKADDKPADEEEEEMTEDEMEKELEKTIAELESIG